MLDFLIAGTVFLVVMFIVFFCISFVVVGTAYAATMLIRHFLEYMRMPDTA